MLLYTTRSSLILCLILIPSVWPQSTKSLKELFGEIFVTPPSSVNSVTSGPDVPSEQESGDKLGADTGEQCQTDAGVAGICREEKECSSESSQRGNCIGFLEVCCPSSGPVINPNPPIGNRRLEGCGRRNPSGIGARINVKDQLQFAYFGEFPWMVGILTNQVSDDGVWNSKTYQGGGTLIGPRAVITAAHVVRDALLKGTQLKVRAGESDTEQEEHFGYVERSVQTVITHEQFNHKNFRNDIALLILKEQIEPRRYIDFACLPRQGEEPPIVKNCIATGWGKDQYGSKGVLQHRLKKIEMPIVPRDECQERLRTTRLGPFFNLHSSFICAGGSTLDTCEGDGGSPLICPIPDVRFRYTVHGIVAWGVDCADGTPGGYVDVADFRDWIDSKMREANLDTSTYQASIQ